jgi:hypothetical protein
MGTPAGLIVQSHVKCSGRNPGFEVWMAAPAAQSCLIDLVESVLSREQVVVVRAPWVTTQTKEGVKKQRVNKSVPNNK